jgi:hypothetical protein
MKKPNTFNYPPVRPTREPWLARIGKVLAFIVVVLVFGVLMPIFLIDWMAGCGETYTDAAGKVHAYECVFIPTSKTTD